MVIVQSSSSKTGLCPFAYIAKYYAMLQRVLCWVPVDHVLVFLMFA
jgi:hypothetical protein